MRQHAESDNRILLRGVDCEYASPSEKQGTVLCSLGKYGGKVHIGTCWHCLGIRPDGWEPPQLPEPEPPCQYRGEGIIFVPCCNGKERAVSIKCSAEDTPDEMVVQMCCEEKCKSYKVSK